MQLFYFIHWFFFGRCSIETEFWMNVVLNQNNLKHYIFVPHCTILNEAFVYSYSMLILNYNKHNTTIKKLTEVELSETIYLNLN